MPHLFVFGYGYSARRIGDRLRGRGWTLSGTRRNHEDLGELEAAGVRAHVFAGDGPSRGVARALRTATHVLLSVPPDEHGDPVLRHHRHDVVATDSLEWIGYLSTTGVYGDRSGDWVDEETVPEPGSVRSRRRLEAERSWAEVAAEAGTTLQIFRLAGIYGPGRSILDRLRAGTARRIVRPGLVFNRVHVDDIAGAVVAGIDCPGATGVFNVADDLPGPPQDVIVFGAELIGVEPPPEVSLEAAGLSEIGRGFFAENKRVAALRLRHTLGYRLEYPTFREGLTAISDLDLPQAVD